MLFIQSLLLYKRSKEKAIKTFRSQKLNFRLYYLFPYLSWNLISSIPTKGEALFQGKSKDSKSKS